MALAPAHFADGTAPGVFFVAAALAQMAAAASVVAWPAPRALAMAGTLSLAMVVAYATFRLVPAPGADVAEGVDAIGLVTQDLQVLAAMACFVLYRRLGRDSPGATIAAGTPATSQWRP